LSDDPIDAFGRGRSAKVPYLIGSNSMEIPAAFAGPGFRSLIKLSPQQTAQAIKLYGSKAAYQAHIVTDVVFGEPARALARDHAISGHPTYLYRFSVTSAAAPRVGGAVHASDRQYVFQTLKASPWPTDARDEAQARMISAYWVAFAKTGDPNSGAGRPHWPRYDSKDQLMDFTNDGPRAEATPDAAVLDLIGESYRKALGPR
jgi:para-nitrobenzyl esterase